MMAHRGRKEIRSEDRGNVSTIDIHKILPNSYQPKKNSMKRIEELADPYAKKALSSP